MKKLLAIVLCLAILLVGCSEKAKPVGENSTTPERIGVIQFVQHGALDSAYDGFVDGLAEEGYVDGVNIIIDRQNAQGEISNTNTIATKLVNDKCDIILAIATPAAQAVANVTQDIPVLFTAVTDPVDAGLVESIEKPGRNVTGTSDLAPIKNQIDLLMKFVPDAKTVGLLYSSNEANSLVQATEAKEALDAIGVGYKDFTVSESNQIQQVVQSSVGEVDALFSSTDNMIASAMPQVSAIATENGIPIIVGEQGQVNDGALAAIGINFYALGKLTAKQAIRIMNGENPADIPVEYQTEFELTVNEETLKALGLTIPEGLE